MNFVLNIDPAREPVGEIDAHLNVGGVHEQVNAPLLYAEYRSDPTSYRQYVCVVFPIDAGEGR